MIGIVIAAVLIGIGIAYVRAFESGSVAFSGQTYVREILLFARSKPLTSVAGHAAYYGFGAIAAMALWPSLLREGARLGPGAFLALAGAGLMSMDAESRRLNASAPLVGLLAAIVLARLCDEGRKVTALLVAAVVVSKLWWLLTGPTLFPGLHEPANYTNTQGPNMSPEAVVAHLLATAVIGGVLAWTARARSTSSL